MKIILARIFDFILITLTKLFKWILKFKWSNLHIYLHKINSIFNFIYFLNILKNSLKILKILTMFFGGTTMFLFTEFQYDDFYNYINIIYDNLYNYYKNVIEYIIEKLHNLISHSPYGSAPHKGRGGVKIFLWKKLMMLKIKQFLIVSRNLMKIELMVTLPERAPLRELETITTVKLKRIIINQIKQFFYVWLVFLFVLVYIILGMMLATVPM